MQPVFIIKPDVKTVCLINMIKVAAAVLIMVAVVTYSKYLFDFSIFAEVFDFTAQDAPDTGSIIANFTMAALVASLLAFTISYLSVSKRQYVFYPDRVEMYKNFLIFNVSQKTAALMNVVSVRAVREGETKLFGLGKIVLELSGTQEKIAELEDIQNPEYYVPYVQKLVDNIKAQFAAKYKYNYTMEQTLSGL